MSEESIDKRRVRLFRLVLAIVILIVAGCFVVAYHMDCDIIAGIACLILGLSVVVLGKDKNDPKLHLSIVIGIGLGAFFLWMFVKYLIVA